MFKLQRYFSLASLIAIIGVTILLAFLYRQVATSQLVAQAESQNVALTQVLARTLWPEFGGFLMTDMDMPDDELRAHPEIARLREALLEQLDDLSVVKVKVYNLEGNTVFSTELAQIGEDKSQNAGFLSARDKQVASELTFRDTFSAFESVIEDRNVISSYVPIQPGGTDGPVEGVFEVYTDVTPLVSRIETIQREVVLAVVVLLAGLYGVLYLIIRRADRILKEQHNQQIEAEEALKQSNDLLESRVEKRTEELKEISDKLQLELKEGEVREAEREILLQSEMEQRRLAEALTRVGAALSSTLDLTELLELIARESSALYDVDSAFVWLLEGDELVGISGFGPGTDDFVGLRVPLEDRKTVGARVIRERRPIFINDATRSESVNAGLVELFNIQSLLGVPLINGERVVGALVLIETRNPHRFGSEDIEIAAILGNEATIAIGNARLFDETVRRTNELTSLLEAARVASSTVDPDEMVRLIAEQMVKALGVNGCVLSRWDREADQVVTWFKWLADGGGDPDNPGTVYSLAEFESTRKVLQNNEAIVIQANNPDADPSEVAWMRDQGVLSCLMLPLGSGDKVIGLVEVLETRQERRFTPDDIQLCHAIANQAAVSIEKARLFENTRLQLQRLAALREIDIAITASLDRRVTLNILLDQVISTLQIEAADILLLNSHTQTMQVAAQRGFPSGSPPPRP
ncbi:MAG: GAF domain-containing protein, partial [Anaerolineales bacterium]|nr:GAF domain-containing protein [Anaerolineales bacterium]